MNPQSDEPKVFDVKRSKIVPPHTSKPVIVGHHPTMPDPMIQTPQPAAEPQPQTAAAPLQPAPQMQAAPPDTPAPQSPLPSNQDLKVHLPAGEAARSSGKMMWLLLIIVAIAAGGAVGYLVIK